ncbi:MAG TPA: putative zinc-binding protein [Anaerolineales bacterium]
MTERTRTSTVLIVPCSGIGKSFGSVSREAAYDIIEDLRPACTQLMPLALLVLGDESSRAAMQENPAITIDGCKLACAAKMVRQTGGSIAQEIAVLDVYRRHKEFRPEGIAELNEQGRRLARVLAEEVATAVDGLIGEEQERPHG